MSKADNLPFLRPGLAIVLALVGTMLAACRSDPWVNVPSGETQLFFSNPLAEKEFVEIDENAQESAQQLLASVAFVEIARSNISKYRRDPPTFDETKRIFLVRAVRANPGGIIRVFQRDNEIYVYHGAVGDVSSVTHSALLVALDREPSGVFVNSLIAK